MAQLCRITSQLIRLHERMARREPHLFDYAAIDRRLAWEAEVQRALERIYGAAPAPSPHPVGTSSTSSPIPSSLAPSDGERAGVRGIPLLAQIAN